MAVNFGRIEQAMQDVTDRQFAARVERLVMAPGSNLDGFRHGGPYNGGASIRDPFQYGGIPVVVDRDMPEGTCMLITSRGDTTVISNIAAGPDGFLYLAPPEQAEQPAPVAEVPSKKRHISRRVD